MSRSRRRWQYAAKLDGVLEPWSVAATRKSLAKSGSKFVFGHADTSGQNEYSESAIRLLDIRTRVS